MIRRCLLVVCLLSISNFIFAKDLSARKFDARVGLSLFDGVTIGGNYNLQGGYTIGARLNPFSGALYNQYSHVEVTHYPTFVLTYYNLGISYAQGLMFEGSIGHEVAEAHTSDVDAKARMTSFIAQIGHHWQWGSGFNINLKGGLGLGYLTYNGRGEIYNHKSESGLVLLWGGGVDVGFVF